MAITQAYAQKYGNMHSERDTLDTRKYLGYTF